MAKTFKIFGGILLSVVLAAGFTACGEPEEDDGYLYLTVSPSKVLYNPMHTSQNEITIDTSSPWTVTVSNPGLELSAMSGGSGKQKISVTKMVDGETYTATFTTTRIRTDGAPEIRTISVSTGTFNWAELPETVKSSADYRYIVHYARTVKTNKNVRNYSACYDTRRHNPMYVAFPYHDIYHEGGSVRTSPDPWRPDPDMTDAEQSIIYPANWDSWTPGGPATYVTWRGGSNNYSYTRGHLMRSAERGAGSAGAGTELNVQTFYPTNIAPERLKYYSHWEDVEMIMPDNWNCRDTIYCVVGCYYANDDYKTYDATTSGSRSSRSKEVVVPAARYKVFLRTKLGNTGKSIAQCNPNEVMAIGFWFEQNFGPAISGDAPPLNTIIYSVDDIEKKTGNTFDFFPQAPDGVTGSYNINDWPGLSAIAN